VSARQDVPDDVAVDEVAARVTSRPPLERVLECRERTVEMHRDTRDRDHDCREVHGDNAPPPPGEESTQRDEQQIREVQRDRDQGQRAVRHVRTIPKRGFGNQP
jgi:hypothetical protein